MSTASMMEGSLVTEGRNKRCRTASEISTLEKSTVKHHLPVGASSESITATGEHAASGTRDGQGDWNTSISPIGACQPEERMYQIGMSRAQVNADAHGKRRTTTCNLQDVELSAMREDFTPVLVIYERV